MTAFLRRLMFWRPRQPSPSGLSHPERLRHVPPERRVPEWMAYPETIAMLKQRVEGARQI